MNRVRALGVGMLALLLAPGAAIGQDDQGYGEPVKAVVAGHAVEVRARTTMSKRSVNGKIEDCAFATLSFEVAPKSGGDAKAVFGLSSKLALAGVPEDANETRRRLGMGGDDGMMSEDFNRIHARRFALARPGQPAAEAGPRWFMVQRIMPCDDGIPPKEIAAINGELMVGQLAETEYVFAGADLAPGMEMKQQGVNVRLYCFDLDDDALSAGIRLRGPAERLQSAFGGGTNLSGRAAYRWTLETEDGTKIPSGGGGMSGGGGGDGELTARLTTQFPSLKGKKPKSVTLTMTKLDGDWQRHPFKLEKVPLPAPPKARAGMPAPVAAPAKQ